MLTTILILLIVVIAVLHHVYYPEIKKNVKTIENYFDRSGEDDDEPY